MDYDNSDDEYWACYFCKRDNSFIWSAFLKRNHQFCSGDCVIKYLQKKRSRKRKNKSTIDKSLKKICKNIKTLEL